MGVGLQIRASQEFSLSNLSMRNRVAQFGSIMLAISLGLIGILSAALATVSASDNSIQGAYVATSRHFESKNLCLAARPVVGPSIQSAPVRRSRSSRGEADPSRGVLFCFRVPRDLSFGLVTEDRNDSKQPNARFHDSLRFQDVRESNPVTNREVDRTSGNFSVASGSEIHRVLAYSFSAGFGAIAVGFLV